MKAITTGMLNTVYLRKLKRYNIVATICAVLIMAFGLLWMLLRIGGSQTIAIVSDGAYAGTALLGASWALKTAYRARRGVLQFEARYQLAWLLIGLGLLISGIAGAWNGYLEYSGQQALPFVVDLLAGLYYPFVFVGLLFMPDTRQFRVTMIFDALIVSFCILALCWFFIIGPSYEVQVGHGLSWAQFLELGTALIYPCGDIFLLLALVLLIQRGIAPALRLSFVLISVSFVANLWADSAYAYTYAVTGKYHLGMSSIDPFWLIGFLLCGLAALYQYEALARQAYQENVLSQVTSSGRGNRSYSYSYTRMQGWQRIQNMLIYLPLACVLGLVVFAEIIHNGWISDSLAVLSAFIASLVAVRHFFSARENESLLREREQRHQESEHLRVMITQLTAILDLGRLRDRIVGMLIDELGCTAAMLLLLEEYSENPSQHPHLLVSTASVATRATKWCLHGDNLLYQIVRSGKKSELFWDDYEDEIPVEVLLWQQKQHMPTMVFYPLTYQEKVLGCIGVAQHSVAYHKAPDPTLIESYIEQIGPILERSHLYQEARERETFARAMVTIATRLNEAVVEPSEISQLICEEGAKAVRADYVLLYRRDEQWLLPHAATANGQGQPLWLEDWPDLYIDSNNTDSNNTDSNNTDSDSPDSYSRAIASLEGDNAGKGSAWQESSASIMNVTRRQTIPLIDREENGARASDCLSVLPPQQVLALRAELAEHYIPTAILAPLVAGGHLIGLLVFARVQPPGANEQRTFTASDLQRVQDFVEQARVAFANAQLYENVQKAHERLQELDQLKDQFMVTASHELRTPLTAVQGYIELMVQFGEVLPLEQRQEFLEKAQRGCEELAVLLENVMDASRIEAEESFKTELIKRVPVREIVERIILMIEPQLAQEQREVQVDIPAHLCAYADPVRLRQVLTNVSVNAMKYSPMRTPIRYAAQALVGQRVVVISITDKGRGVAPSEQGHIFQRFFRLERDINSPIRGSGLGLYISRRLVEDMGGKIWVESKGIPGEGSTFHIQLPLA